MACRRSVSTTATVVTRRFRPSFSYIVHKYNDDTKPHPSTSSPSQPTIILPRGSYNVTTEIGSLYRGRTCLSFAQPMGLGLSYCRYMSSTIGEGSDKFDDIGYIAEIITDKTVEAVASQAPAVNEVAVAAADSFYPVAALQYLIDGVHSFTGLNWWASIALTTILIRAATVPLLIDQLKATTKLNLMRPRLEEFRQQMQDKAMDPDALAEGQKRVKALFNEYGVTPFTPLKGLFIQGPVFISFFLAIRNMAEKVPSFKTGGALWFTDLTSPDSLLILPVLTAMTFWITVECNMQEGLEGNPIAKTMKNYSRILAVIAVPVMMNLPKALFCYWLTSNLFSLTYGLLIRRPEVKKVLGLSAIPVPPPVASIKGYTTVKPELSVPTVTEPSKVSGRRISPSSIISQRIRTLEKQVKRSKKNKKM